MELLVVLPVYNEQNSIRGVIDQWCPQLDSCRMEYTILAINDGSTDHTADILQELQTKWGRRLEIISQTNMGHGQTALKGYRIAAERQIPWVFQIDSDGQCDPQYFPRMWQSRHGYDIISAYRARRDDGLRRILISVILRGFILLFFGINCRDANVPYRLMATRSIEPLVKCIPPTFYLANVGLAVLAMRARLKHKFFPIRFLARHGGEPCVPYGKFGNKATELHSQLKNLLKTCDLSRRAEASVKLA